MYIYIISSQIIALEKRFEKLILRDIFGFCCLMLKS